MKLIERKVYLDKMINVIGTPDIKVITGVRRSGKSKLLEAFRNYVEKTYKDANIIHINYNLTKFEDFKDYHVLNDYVITVTLIFSIWFFSIRSNCGFSFLYVR